MSSNIILRNTILVFLFVLMGCNSTKKINEFKNLNSIKIHAAQFMTMPTPFPTTDGNVKKKKYKEEIFRQTFIDSFKVELNKLEPFIPKSDRFIHSPFIVIEFFNENKELISEQMSLSTYGTIRLKDKYYHYNQTIYSLVCENLPKVFCHGVKESYIPRRDIDYEMR